MGTCDGLIGTSASSSMTASLRLIFRKKSVLRAVFLWAGLSCSHVPYDCSDTKGHNLDLSKNLEYIDPIVKSLGAFADIFRGTCRIPERGRVQVAIKQLRVHVEDADWARVKYVSSDMRETVTHTTE